MRSLPSNPPSTLYLYQLIGTWGTVFFPPHYTQFRSWLTGLHFNSTTGSSPLQSPCVPHLLSNAWWKRKKWAVWSVWAIRYCFERGLFSMYSLHTTNHSTEAGGVSPTVGLAGVGNAQPVGRLIPPFQWVRVWRSTGGRRE